MHDSTGVVMNADRHTDCMADVAVAMAATDMGQGPAEEEAEAICTATTMDTDQAAICTAIRHIPATGGAGETATAEGAGHICNTAFLLEAMRLHMAVTTTATATQEHLTITETIVIAHHAATEIAMTAETETGTEGGAILLEKKPEN